MTTSRVIPFFFSVFSFLCLYGCTFLPSRPPEENVTAAWQSRQALLAPIDKWEIEGRISVSTSEEGGHASMRWVRRGERHEIDLTGPLGRGHIKLTQDEHSARLVDEKNETYEAKNAQQLLYTATGWQVPLEGLRYWILGIPVAGLPMQHRLDEAGRLKSLRQLGWDIKFLEYSQHGGYDLPRKMFLMRQLPVSSEVENGSPAFLEVRLVVDRWVLQPGGVRE